ncbi:BnaC01g23320D [Brassica napus]|uniref:BnaC01g23320D protein n=2 Tax=Brassica TaxID=3705 RepID=A0A078FTY7_BRANA|nr:BnaC01g23320D [Brassica napus]VDD50441.1 unnamed protein product [Brassica oleracea]
MYSSTPPIVVHILDFPAHVSSSAMADSELPFLGSLDSVSGTVPFGGGAILAPLSSLTVWFTGLSALLELPPSWHSSRFQAAVAAVVDSQKQASPYIRRDQGN